MTADNDDKVVKLEPKDIQKAKTLLSTLSEEDVNNIMKYIGGKFVAEITQGVVGEIEYEGNPFFEVIDRIYESVKVRGCYFCDPDIDGNETQFNYPAETRLCMSCQLKVANLLKAFEIDHETLFPGMAKRDHQKVIYDLEDDFDITTGTLRSPGKRE